MSVTLNIPLYWHHWTNGAEAITVKGNTVGECLKGFASAFPAFNTVLFAGEGKLNESISICVNGKNIKTEGPEKAVRDGDIITLTVSGGCCE